MFSNRYEQRLAAWSTFRDNLEDSDDPFRDVIEFYKQAPYVSIHTDPWNQDTWPTAWELVHENQYDDFSRVLGMYYSLQLTERFKGSKFEIHICTVNNISHEYLLIVNDTHVLGYEDDIAILRDQLPTEIQSQQIYDMSCQQ